MISRQIPDWDRTGELIRRARDGDGCAWAELVGLHSIAIDRCCRDQALQPADAEEVRQEVWLRVFRKLKQYKWRGTVDSFQGWLYTIARRVCIDFHRARARSRMRTIGGDGGLALLQNQSADESLRYRGDDVEAAEQVALLLQVVRENFNERDVRIFEATVLNQQSGQATADELGVSLNVVYLARVRVFSLLRRVCGGRSRA